ncbi:hypothetical protein SGFS_084820 [Streptomyces graminofaciens]|uniref:Uncharacterized protein n=1 Tax=Streptomyces graminofaciens TaxID=68212 RepID=A0ABM8HJM6_9ACTN|nr:hypothetical protein [Streptomyces graminofaciens]BBC37188.1 hypothetical protein SGFS_084820 [Streptomyces graminofaciens]
MTAHDIARLLPAVPDLRDRLRAMAMLEAILSPERADRYHSYDRAWSPGVEVATMSTGSGDEFSVVFEDGTAYIRGFAHESPMSPYAADGPWPGVLDKVPEPLRRWVSEPAFTDEDGIPVVTACLWRGPSDDGWRTGDIDYPDGPDPDGANHLFRLLATPGPAAPDAFREFAEDHYGEPLDPAAVRHVYALRPLTGAVVAALNGDVTLADLAEDAEAVGYPQVG